MKAKAMLFVAAIAVLFAEASVVMAGTEGVAWTYYGYGAGTNNSGSYNTFIGRDTGYTNTTGQWNTFVGDHAGFANITGNYNILLGYMAGYSNTTGSHNIFVGMEAGRSNTEASHNIFVGYRAGYNNTSGYDNTLIGMEAGFSNRDGEDNTFLGGAAGYSNWRGDWNTFIGQEAGYKNMDGDANTSVGYKAGWKNAGSNNTFIGTLAGYSSTGHSNVFVGYGAGNTETGSNKLYIDNCYAGGSGCLDPLIYGEFDNRILQLDGSFGIHSRPLYDFDVSSDGKNRSSMHFSLDGSDVGGWITSVAENNFFLSSGAVWDSTAGGWLQKSSDGNAVIAGSGAAGYRVLTRSGCTVGNVCAATTRMTIDYSGKLQMGSGAYCSTGGVWTNASSREYKDNIAPLSSDEAAMALEGLNPVSFTYKADPEESHLGFIAEEVPQILATKDRKGMSPMDVVAVLTKVVQEQQQVVREKSKIIDQQKEDMLQLQAAVQNQRQLLREMAEQVQQLKSEVNGLKSQSWRDQLALVR